MHQYKKVLLIILDGFGVREAVESNAVANAKIPNWNHYTKNYAFNTIDASGNAVGLPEGQFGNSEVGHLNIGAGRIVQQDITRIDLSIENRSFNENIALNQVVKQNTSGTIHIIGLLSDGGVHAHIKHIFALINFALEKREINNIYIHAILDGRDTPPQSAFNYLEELSIFIASHTKVKIATIAGRFYAMDRDKRYERIKLFYDAITFGQGIEKDNYSQVIESSYAIGYSDEFIKPHVLDNYDGFHNGDSIIIANYRSDRIIQLTDALTNQNFTYFNRSNVALSVATMTCYDSLLNVEVAFSPQIITNTLGQYIAKLGFKQLRVAETEKYPHVTYFFNGGEKLANINEDWQLIPSPREVATYDLKPEMSLPQVTDKLIEAIKENKYDFIITNFANADMVGHSGDYLATIKAVEALDNAIGQSVNAMLTSGGEVLIVADHGNCEEMFDKSSNQKHTQHTNNPVPFLYIGREATIKTGGALKDVAPSILHIAGLAKPIEMTGENLINFVEDK